MNLTDEQIEQALKHCSSQDCNGCPCRALAERPPTICLDIFLSNLADYVERKNAEIKRLNDALDLALKFNTNAESEKRLANIESARMSTDIEQARAEAFREFAEAFKAEFANEQYRNNYVIDDEMLDNLVKRKTGDAK